MKQFNFQEKLAAGVIGAFVLGTAVGSIVPFAFAKSNTSDKSIIKLSSKNVGCPDKSTLKNVINKLVNNPNIHLKIVGSKPIMNNNLCEVAVKFNGMVQVLYTSPDTRYLVFGNIIDMQKKINLTQQYKQKFMVVSKNVFNQLNNYVAYTYYQGKSYYSNPPKYSKYIYMIVDPKCPFCHMAEPKVEKWANQNGYALRVILFPLSIHPGSFQSAEGLYCHQKGVKSLYNAYNQSKPLSSCASGKQYIQKVEQFMMQHRMEATPTFITQNRKIIEGVPMDISVLEK